MNKLQRPKEVTMLFIGGIGNAFNNKVVEVFGTSTWKKCPKSVGDGYVSYGENVFVLIRDSYIEHHQMTIEEFKSHVQKEKETGVSSPELSHWIQVIPDDKYKYIGLQLYYILLSQGDL